MEGAKNQCTRQFSLAQDCTTTLNPLNWVKNTVVLGGQAPGSSQFPVTLGSLFVVDAVTGEYTQQAATPLSASTYSNGECKGALQEIVYTVEVKSNAPDQISKHTYYSVTKVTADVVVQNSAKAANPA